MLPPIREQLMLRTPTTHRPHIEPSPPACTTSNSSSSFPSPPLSRFAPLLPTTPPTVVQLSSPLGYRNPPPCLHPATTLPPVLRNYVIQDMELHKAPIGDYGLKLLIWKVGVASWNPTQQFHIWLTFSSRSTRILSTLARETLITNGSR